MSNPDTVRSTQMPANYFSLWFYTLEVHTVTTHVNLYLYSYVSAPLVFKKDVPGSGLEPIRFWALLAKTEAKKWAKNKFFFHFCASLLLPMLQNLRGEDFFAMMIQTESDNVYNFLLKSPFDSKKRERKKNWRKRSRKRERKIKTENGDSSTTIRWFYYLATYTQVHFALKCKFVFTTYIFGERISLKMYLLIGVTKLAIKNDSGRKIVNMIGFKE